MPHRALTHSPLTHSFTHHTLCKNTVASVVLALAVDADVVGIISSQQIRQQGPLVAVLAVKLALTVSKVLNHCTICCYYYLVQQHPVIWCALLIKWCGGNIYKSLPTLTKATTSLFVGSLGLLLLLLLCNLGRHIVCATTTHHLLM